MQNKIYFWLIITAVFIASRGESTEDRERSKNDSTQVVNDTAGLTNEVTKDSPGQNVSQNIATPVGNITLRSPKDKEKVPERLFVRGTVKNVNSRVWVIIHPMTGNEYWVQPSATIKKNGEWGVQVYVGRPGDIDKEVHFEIMAVANPKQELKEGIKLSEWPNAEYKTDFIEVIRE